MSKARIHKARLNLQFDSVHDQARLSERLERCLLDTLAQFPLRDLPDGAKLSLERLSIDIGDLSSASLEADFRHRLMHQLREHLARFIKSPVTIDSTHQDVTVDVLSELSHQLQLLLGKALTPTKCDAIVARIESMASHADVPSPLANKLQSLLGTLSGLSGIGQTANTCRTQIDQLQAWLDEQSPVREVTPTVGTADDPLLSLLQSDRPVDEVEEQVRKLLAGSGTPLPRSFSLKPWLQSLEALPARLRRRRLHVLRQRMLQGGVNPFDDAQSRGGDTRVIGDKRSIDSFNQPTVSAAFVEPQSSELSGVASVPNSPTFSSALQNVLSLVASDSADQLLVQAIQALSHSKDIAAEHKAGINAWLLSYESATGFLRRQCIQQLKHALDDEGVEAFARPWSLTDIKMVFEKDKARTDSQAPSRQNARASSGRSPKVLVTELLAAPHLPLALARSLKQWRDNHQTIPEEERHKWLQALLKQLHVWQTSPKGTGSDTAYQSIRSQLLRELDDAGAITLPTVWRSAGQRCHQRLSSADDRLSLATALEQLLTLFDFIVIEHPAMSHWLRPRRKRWQQLLSRLDPAQCVIGKQRFPASVNVVFRQQAQTARRLVYGQEQLSRLKAALPQRELTQICREYLQTKVNYPDAFRASLSAQLANESLPSRAELGNRIRHFEEELSHQSQSLEEDTQRFRQIVASRLAGADSQLSTELLKQIASSDIRDALGEVLASKSEEKTYCLPEPARASVQSLLHDLEQAIKQPTSSLRQVSSLEDGLTEDAGLSVLWPHLPTLFDKLQLLTESGTAFVSEAAQLRGMALLVAAAGIECDDDKVPRCMTAALLTGLPADTSPDVLPVLTEQETRAVEGMLQAVIRQWPVLKSMPPAGLRTMFLQRQGYWDMCDGGWRLTVADQAQDVLLQGLPWPISMIRLPWLNELLSIHWKKGEGFSLSSLTATH